MGKELPRDKSSAFEEAASILSNLAIEGIYLSSKRLEGLLEKSFDLGPKLRQELIKIFGKNGNGKNLPGEGK